ncbi:hypothetical protein BN946_scf184868.g24 [Trametes cinnabarina]|uniref:Uncharacterized protein n=1 Tax=Pycnoporus cinnabarinus TaxID=5643 RepID=A0A060SQF2_PYCCI|nr:hypothetical protein BN946_scf184868.g24 [Trametes cinnabarina]
MLVNACSCAALYGTLILLLARLASPSLVNHTIDDQLGDSVTGELPTHAPDDKWAQGQICTGCAMHPGIVDPGKTFQGTWLDSTYHPGQPDRVITASFTGRAVYVFNLIANSFPYITTETNLSFSVDGTYMGQYIHLPDPSQTIIYDVCVFSHTDLADQPHTLEMRANGPNASLILFDYIIYTADAPDSPSEPPISVTVSTPPISSTISSSMPPIISSFSTSLAVLSSSALTASADSHSSSLPLGASSTGAASFASALPHTSSGAIPGSIDSSLSSSTNSNTAFLSSSVTPATSTSYPPSSSATASPVSVGAIIGGVVGAALAVSITIAILLYCRRARRVHASEHAQPSSRTQITPVYHDPKSALDTTHLPPARPGAGGFGAPTITRSEGAEPTDDEGFHDAPDAHGAQLATVSDLLPVLRDMQVLLQEVEQLRRRDMEEPGEQLPPRYDQLSDR